jgi:hypothetical protein
MLAKKIGGAGRGMHKQDPSAATAPTLAACIVRRIIMKVAQFPVGA